MALQPVYEGDAEVLSSAAIHVTPQQQELIGMQYGVAEYTPANRIFRGVARVGVDETRIALVQTKLEGFIDQLYVKSVGETVRKGQALLSVYNRREYLMAQSDYLNAIMVPSGTGLTPVDAASPDVHAARESVLAAAARQRLEMLGFTEYQIQAVERARQPLRSFPIYAPIDGVVTEFHAALNGAVGMQPLLTIADLSNVWVTANFDVGRAAAIRPGQSAILRVPYVPGREFPATVDRVLPELDPETRSSSVRFQVDNPGLLLKPQMYGEIELRSPGLKKLTVPTEAVVDGGRTQAVFVDLGGGYLEPRKVRIGERFGDRIEIVQGLAPGQRIVTSGNFLLESESRLRPRP
jgi:Cu(I)/Ag(I) efflux system membrane fusion protein